LTTNDVDLVRSLLGESVANVNERAAPVLGDLRTEWRLALLLLVLGKCHSHSATLEQLHVLNSSALFEETADALRNLLGDESESDAWNQPVIRYEPALSRAVDIAVGTGLAEWTETRRLRLSEDGKTALRQLNGNSSLLAREKRLLAKLNGRVSQAGINRALGARS
jgi:hypothetical protein